MVGVVERDHRLPTGVRAGDLDGVLDGLGAGVEEHGALVVVARGQLVEPLGHRDVPLVGRDHEAGVGEGRDLLLHRRDDPRGARADRGDRDARAEVDEHVAVDVLDDAAVRADGVHRHHRADAGGDRGGLAGGELARARAGELGDEAARPGGGTSPAVAGRCSVLVMGLPLGVCGGSERGRDGEDPLGRGLPHADAAVDVLEAEAGDVAAGEQTSDRRPRGSAGRSG